MLALSFGLALAPSALADNITIAAPVNGTTVPSPVWIRAHNVGCNGATPTWFGYSVDNNSTLVAGVTDFDVDTTASLPAGTHTIHYKSWVGGSECPSVSTTFTVTGGSSSGSGSSGSGSSGSGSSGSGSSGGSNITVTSPVNGASGVASPLWVRAHNNGCGGTTTWFGYSIDNNSTLYPGSNTSDVDATGVALSAGTHTIHFKAWVGGNVCPVVSTTFTVGSTGSASSGGGSGSSGGSSGGGAVSNLPSNAVSPGTLEGLGGWSGEHDTGTPGWSSGSMVYPATTPSYDTAREFYMTYSGKSGERWHVSYGNNPTSSNFALDLYVYIANPSQVQNLELDLNQVTSNGQTVLYGTQCSSDSKTWEYVYQSGGAYHWRPSNVPCNPLTWAANTWHHIQIGFHRDGSGNVTHDWVNFDGTHSTFSGAYGNAALSLGWAKGSMVVNYQVDGELSGSGSVTSYVHSMRYYSW
jgi:hypothetical protein